MSLYQDSTVFGLLYLFLEPIPKNLCRDLAGCSCSSIDEVQYSCTCLQGEKCLLLKGPPKIYIDPPPPHEILPGGNLNVTCRAVAYPFPQIYWQRFTWIPCNWSCEFVEKTKKSTRPLLNQERSRVNKFWWSANSSTLPPLPAMPRTIWALHRGPFMLS